MRDVVGWSVNLFLWRILESRQATEEFATNLQAFQGSFVSDQTVDESISVGDRSRTEPRLCGLRVHFWWCIGVDEISIWALGPARFF